MTCRLLLTWFFLRFTCYFFCFILLLLDEILIALVQSLLSLLTVANTYILRLKHFLMNMLFRLIRLLLLIMMMLVIRLISNDYCRLFLLFGQLFFTSECRLLARHGDKHWLCHGVVDDLVFVLVLIVISLSIS